MSDITDDIDLVNGLGADVVDQPHPEQDNPLQHVPEETMLNLDTVVIDFATPVDQVDTAMRVATEAQDIAANGGMSTLRANELAKDVPQVLGTPDDPVTYTEVPTSVNAGKAAQILERGANAHRDGAASKAVALIDRAVSLASGELDTNEKNWGIALVNYGSEREQAKEALGGLPEESYEVFIGNESAPEVLSSTYVTGHGEVDDYGSQALRDYILTLRKVVTAGPSVAVSVFGSTTPCVVVGNSRYTLMQIIDGNLEGPSDGGMQGALCLRQWLSIPAGNMGATVTQLREASSTTIEKLRLMATELGDENLGMAATGALIGKVVTSVNVLAAINNALKAATAIAEAGANLYADLREGSKTSIGKTPSVERFAVGRSKLFM